MHVFFSPTLILHEDVVLFAGGEKLDPLRGGQDTMHALFGRTGERLWTGPHPPSGYASAEDLFVINGLVWCRVTSSPRNSGVFTGRDLKTGEVKAEFAPDDGKHMPHHRCHRSKATCDFILTSRTGIEFVDLQRVTFRVKVRTTPGASPDTPGNGFLVFGDSPDEDKLVHCGYRISGKSLSITQGATSAKGNSVSKKADLKANEITELTVTVDLAAQQVTLTGRGETVTCPLARRLDRIEWIGCAVQSVISEFSAIDITGGWVYAIRDGRLLAGSLPPKKHKLVVAWIEIHQEDLLADWELAVNGQNPLPIRGLDQ